MVKNILLTVLVIGLVCFAGAPLAQAAPSQQRVAQAIVVNGQQVQGVTVIQDGAVQSYTCPAPQTYVTADQSSSGWVCYDESTGIWLMHALPQQTATVYNQTPTYDQTPTYSDGSTVYYGYPYAYPYGYPYYGYGYPGFGFYGAPFFGFGFGNGFNNFHGRNFNGNVNRNFNRNFNGNVNRNFNRNFNGNFNRNFNGHGAVFGRGFAQGPVGHGSFGHAPGGSFGHVGGGHFGGMGGGGGHFGGGGGHMGGMGGGGHR